MGVHCQDEAELVGLAIEMADLPGAADAKFVTDVLPFPAVEEVAVVVPDRGSLDTVMRDRSCY